MIVTLAVLLGLVALVASYAVVQRSGFRAITSEIERDYARRLALAGVARAMAELGNVDEASASLADEWSQLGEYRGENFIVDDGSFRIQILDEGSLVSLNTAGETQLLNLGLTTEQVDCLLDWREPGQEPRPEGAKDEYYNNLPTPYNAALAPLKTLDELLLIKGFSARTLYELPEETQSNQPLVTGTDQDQPVLAEMTTVWSAAPWTRSDGQARLNVNTATQQQLVQSGIPQGFAQAIIQRRNTQGTFATLGSVLTVNGANAQNAASVLNNLSIDASTQVTGKLNINTVSEAALNSLANTSPDVTQAILTAQEQGFTQLGDLATVPGVTIQWLQQNVDQFAIGARVFRVRVIGRYHQQSMSLEAVVQIENGTPRILGFFETPSPNMAIRWRWNEEPSADIELVEPE